MKQLLICLSFVCFFASNSFAQINDADLQQELEQLQNQMKSAFGDMEILFGTMPKSLDSLDLQQLGFGNLDLQQLGLGDIDKADIEELMGNLLPQGTNIDIDEMIQQFENDLQGIDMQQFESIFKQFGLDQPAIPSPDQLDKDGNVIPSKKKTERKKYSM